MTKPFMTVVEVFDRTAPWGGPDRYEVVTTKAQELETIEWLSKKYAGFEDMFGIRVNTYGAIGQCLTSTIINTSKEN